MTRKWSVCLLILVLLLSACRQENDEVTPVAPAGDTTTDPTPTTLTEATTLPTATLPPTSTSLPTPEITVPDTPTPIPTATGLPNPTATALPEAVTLYVPEDFADNRSFLTGETVEDPSILLRRPINVKISNSPPEWVRPQSGLSFADIVFEHETEGPITRFTAIIQSQTPPAMGPIRSARLIDVELPAIFQSALAYSGSSIGVANKLGASPFNDRIIRSFEEGYYRTGEDKPWEHTLYGDALGWWRALDAKDQNIPPAYSTVWAFDSLTPAGGTPASTITFDYESWTVVDWVYNPDDNLYYRHVDGEPHVDALTGEQITSRNVIGLFALHVLDRNICEHQVATGCSAFSTEIQIWGEGDLVVFRDGQQYTGTWQRAGFDTLLTFHDENGDIIPLQIGNSWVQVLGYHFPNPYVTTP